MLKDLFPKKRRYATITTTVRSTDAPKRDAIPEGLMQKCPGCAKILFSNELEKTLKTCPQCNYHFPLTAGERIGSTLDEGHFFEFDANMTSVDPLNFPDYRSKIQKAQEVSGLEEALVTGEGRISGHPLVIGILDAAFIQGSMGSVVGEKLVRAVDHAIEKRLPLVVFSASGGARMQEGTYSLIQMAKTTAALNRLGREGLLFISVLTDPTYGGVTASFASLGDIMIAEPKARIGFAGRRVIEQTLRQTLPDDFQTAEFQLKHGMLDLVVHRQEMRATLERLLGMHVRGGATVGR